jgi:hypothetical protein
MISVGTQELAVELLEKRSAIYSSRPSLFYVVRVHYGCSSIVALLNITLSKERYIDPTGLIWTLTKQGENHHWGRKLSTICMKRVRAGHTEELQRLEALTTAQEILDDQGRDWSHHIERLECLTASRRDHPRKLCYLY